MHLKNSKLINKIKELTINQKIFNELIIFTTTSYLKIQLKSIYFNYNEDFNYIVIQYFNNIYYGF